MSEFLLEVSKPGDNILDPALEDKNKLFTTKHRVLKIDQNTTEKATVPATTYYSVPHGRAWTPLFMTFAKDVSGVWHPISNGTTPINMESYSNGTSVDTYNGEATDIDVRTIVCVDKLG